MRQEGGRILLDLCGSYRKRIVRDPPMNPCLLIFVLLTVGLLSAWPTAATLPYIAIIIESGSPYFVPKSVTVSTGSPIRWENPTAAEHTVTHTGCVEDGDHCAFDSGLMLPNGTFALPGLAPGQYPYLCRIHPIMRGVITVTEAPQLPSQL
jgi:plastocyanin